MSRKVTEITMKENCTIMLSLMQLNIGGAETHVVELAKELSRRGFRVIVTSNGGVYEKELAEAGILHYTVPLQNKNPLNMWRAYKQLRHIIRTERVDIVHSHARIPSFILGRLHKSLRFPFVTTAHWVFSTKYGLKYLTNWGQQTIAVSEDIKKYLMDNYNIPEKNIIVTINGIDTEKFSPNTDYSEIAREFDLSPDDTVIGYVSRMDEDRSLVAKQLIHLAPELSQDIDRLRILIVGAGNDFEHVKTLADEANRKAGRTVVSLAGARTDINRFVAASDCFVGVSRAALEAMAAGKAVIVAGNEGYIGLFDEHKLHIGIDTNFCCRGCAPSTELLLRDDILRFFAMPENEKTQLAAYGRALVQENYSVKKMVDDNIRLYERVLK